MGRKACILDGHTGRSSNDLNASFDPNYLKNHKGHENNHHERNDCHYGGKGATSRTVVEQHCHEGSSFYANEILS